MEELNEGNHVHEKIHVCYIFGQKIHDSSKASFVGTSHEDYWYLYHDVLSQMTEKITVEWMKQDGY